MVAECRSPHGSMMTLFFTSGDTVGSWNDAKQCDAGKYARYFHAALNAGVYLAPSQFEAAFVSSAHSEKDIALGLKALRTALERCA